MKFTNDFCQNPTWVPGFLLTSVQYVGEFPSVAMLITVWNIQVEHPKGQSLSWVVTMSALVTEDSRAIGGGGVICNDEVVAEAVDIIDMPLETL
jgi:hypothetical protein